MVLKNFKYNWFFFLHAFFSPVVIQGLSLLCSLTVTFFTGQVALYNCTIFVINTYLLYDGQCLNLLTTEYNKAPSYSVEFTRGGIAQAFEWEPDVSLRVAFII